MLKVLPFPRAVAQSIFPPCSLMTRWAYARPRPVPSLFVVKKLADSEKRFDVVITDLRMPMFSGRGVLALASALPELPVIIITAFGGPDVEAQALRLGAFAFLEKPVAAPQLIDVVKRAVARSPIREA